MPPISSPKSSFSARGSASQINDAKEVARMVELNDALSNISNDVPFDLGENGDGKEDSPKELSLTAEATELHKIFITSFGYQIKNTKGAEAAQSGQCESHMKSQVASESVELLRTQLKSLCPKGKDPLLNFPKTHKTDFVLWVAQLVGNWHVYVVRELLLDVGGIASTRFGSNFPDISVVIAAEVDGKISILRLFAEEHKTEISNVAFDRLLAQENVYMLAGVMPAAFMLAQEKAFGLHASYTKRSVLLRYNKPAKLGERFRCSVVQCGHDIDVRYNAMQLVGKQLKEVAQFLCSNAPYQSPFGKSSSFLGDCCEGLEFTQERQEAVLFRQAREDKSSDPKWVKHITPLHASESMLRAKNIMVAYVGSVISVNYRPQQTAEVFGFQSCLLKITCDHAGDSLDRVDFRLLTAETKKTLIRSFYDLVLAVPSWQIRHDDIYPANVAWDGTSKSLRLIDWDNARMTSERIDERLDFRYPVLSKPHVSPQLQSAAFSLLQCMVVAMYLHKEMENPGSGKMLMKNKNVSFWSNQKTLDWSLEPSPHDMNHKLCEEETIEGMLKLVKGWLCKWFPHDIVMDIESSDESPAKKAKIA